MQNHPISSIPFYLSVVLERASYYGLRACLVLFFLSETINLPQVEAFKLYGQGSLALGVAYLAGGLLGLIGQQKIVALSGLGIQLLGTLCLAFSQDSGMAFAGFMLVGVGAGISKPNVLGFLGQLYRRRAVLDSGVTIHYIMVNLGAFLGIWVTAHLSQAGDFSYAFLLCAALLLGSIISLFFTPEETAPAITETESKNQYDNIFIPIVIIVGTIAAIFYWYFYEAAAPEITLMTYDIPGLESYGFEFASSVNTAVIIGLGAVLALVYTLIRVDTTIKLGVGFIFAALGLFVLRQFDPDQLNAGSMLITYFVLMSVAEIFFVPVMFGYVLHKMETKNATLVIGGLSFIFMFAMRNQIFDQFVTLNEVADIATKTMFFFGLVFIGLFFVKRNVRSKSEEETIS